MLFEPKALSTTTLPKEELENDLRNAKRFGPCAIGDKALYLGRYLRDRSLYVPVSSVHRAFKRVAMSRGGFNRKGLFATLPYLVVLFDDGKERSCLFKKEEDVDLFLLEMKQRHPAIKRHSKEAEKLLKERRYRLEEKKRKLEQVKGLAVIHTLDESIALLEKTPRLSIELSAAAKQKRMHDMSNPAYKWVALAITIMGVLAALYGAYQFLHGASFSIFFMLFGFGAIFLFSGAHVLPTSENNRTAILRRFTNSIDAMEKALADTPDFPVPARYAHPTVLQWMEQIIADQRADTAAEALEQLKKDLKALNADVEVDPEEFEDIITIKPLFLVYHYE